DNPIRYAGYYYDEETKNYYLQARYYNPENGAFLALDPHPGDDNEPLSQNGYSYSRNNPNSITDPSGEIWWLVWNGIYGAIDNSYEYVWGVFKKSNYKFKKMYRKLNYKKLTTLAITGALTGMLGGTLGKYLGKARVGVANRLFVTFQWEFKSELARQYSQNGKINVWKALYDAGKGTIQGEARALKLVYQAYKRGGKARTIKVARRV
ncbi:RHS repeat-associated core domain-containing protein, partial [Rummeliibacillus suwonensis]|uniref:RHS repeat-associated core domain-containing protein n=1 Tax=Rummeliibacillus suwonensis TaxID=1306154 RepID=UPI0011B4F82C